MKSIDDFKRVPLGVLPTPLYKLENLSRETNRNIYIKRDDMTGVALGGNKVRKLEFLLADAQEKQTNVVLTAGGPQSNHAMLTAACAARLKMQSVLVLKKRGVLEGGNLILDKLYGAVVQFVDTDSYDDVYAEMEKIMEKIRADHFTPYFIPVGGSVPLGCLGYVNCAREIASQAEALGVKFGHIVSSVGSGGTYAGLTLGAKLYLPGTRSVGIGVCDDPFAEITLDLMRGTAALLESDSSICAEDIDIHYHIGPGYAQPSEEGQRAVQRLARSEGILADPVYTGKGLAGFFQLLEKGYFPEGENILFVHTGGAGALFAVG